MAKAKQTSFEASIKALEDIVTRLESGEMSLEESLKAFEKGVKLTRECNNKLDSVEKKIQELLADNTLKESDHDI